MSLLALVAAIVALVPSQPQQRLAKLYSPGVMQHVIDVRLRQGLITHGDLRGVVGYFSMPSCADIGTRRLVSIYDPVDGVWGHPELLLQTDCSQARDRARHEREALIEVNYETAVRAHFVGEGRTQAKIWEVER